MCCIKLGLNEIMTKAHFTLGVKAMGQGKSRTPIG